MRVKITSQNDGESGEINGSQVLAGCPALAHDKHSKKIFFFPFFLLFFGWEKKELKCLKKRERQNVQFSI